MRGGLLPTCSDDAPTTSRSPWKCQSVRNQAPKALKVDGSRVNTVAAKNYLRVEVGPEEDDISATAEPPEMIVLGPAKLIISIERFHRGDVELI